MNLPWLFMKVHGEVIFSHWVMHDQIPIVRVVPKEPLRVPMGGGVVPSDTVTVVEVRCQNQRGRLQCEAASAADLRVAQEWADRHKNTLLDEFKWHPDIRRAG